MKSNAVFTSSLPPDLLSQLEHYAVTFKLPKNKILETALKDYFERLKKAEYVHSFKRAKGDPQIQNLAEEGLEDYLKILEE